MGKKYYVSQISFSIMLIASALKTYQLLNQTETGKNIGMAIFFLGVQMLLAIIVLYTNMNANNTHDKATFSKTHKVLVCLIPILAIVFFLVFKNSTFDLYNFFIVASYLSVLVLSIITTFFKKI